MYSLVFDSCVHKPLFVPKRDQELDLRSSYFENTLDSRPVQMIVAEMGWLNNSLHGEGGLLGWVDGLVMARYHKVEFR